MEIANYVDKVRLVGSAAAHCSSPENEQLHYQLIVIVVQLWHSVS